MDKAKITDLDGVKIIHDMGSGLVIATVDLSIIKEQDVNARIMKNEMQDQLTANISKRGQLESLPLLVFINGKIEVISGHHRVKSARAAGLKEIVAIIDVSGLNRSQIAAKQLAHNAISGFDDENVLREIAKMITDVDDMLESALNEKYFQNVETAIAKFSTPAIDFDFKTITFTFLPHQIRDLSVLVDALNGDVIGVADLEQFKPFVDALRKVQKFEDVKAIGAAIHLMTKMALESIGKYSVEGEDVNWLPISKVLGGNAISAEAAEVIEGAIKKAEKEGLIQNKENWLLIETLCRNYLEGR